MRSLLRYSRNISHFLCNGNKREECGELVKKKKKNPTRRSTSNRHFFFLSLCYISPGVLNPRLEMISKEMI